MNPTLFRIAIAMMFVFVSDSHADLTGSFNVEQSECKIVSAGMGATSPISAGTVESNSSIGLTMSCIKKDKIISCDYLHEKTGKPKNLPTIFILDGESNGLIFAANEANSSRLHINTKTNRVILSATIFLAEHPEHFGVKLCAGKIKRK